MSYERDENYCTFFPEELFGVRYNYGCYLHDRQYRNEVKKRKTRKQADKHLRDIVYRAFVVADKKYRGYLVSRAMYFAVRLGASRFWRKPKSI